MDLLEIMQNRRSVRKYTEEEIPQEKLAAVLQAGLLSPTGRGRREWEFIVVRDKEMLKKLSDCRDGAAKMLEGANAAIVVLGDEEKSGVWCEDCSIAMYGMHLMASSLGIGSCWIQGRSRQTANGRETEEYVRDLLKFPKNLKLEAILSLGMPAVFPPKRELESLEKEKIHNEVF